MKRWNCILGLVIAACLLNVANAGKPDKPSGKDDTEPSPVIELSPLEGNVLDINEERNGNVEAVGWVQTTSGSHGFYSKLDKAGTVLEFRGLQPAAPEGFVADRSDAVGINPSGTIVGHAFDDEAFPPYWPLLWSDSTSSAFLLPLPEGFEGYLGTATSINNEGIAVGHIWKGLDNAVIAWKVDLSGENPVVEDCITFLHSTSSYNIDWYDGWNKITESGLGIATVVDAYGSHAYRFLLEFDHSTGELSVATESLFAEPAQAIAINDFGSVGGYYPYPTGLTAFAVDFDGNPMPLDGLPPSRDKGVAVEYRNWRVNAINNLEIKVGWVIGIATKYGNWWGQYPAKWAADGGVTFLHDDWDACLDINDAGWLGGMSKNRSPAIELP